MANAIPCDLCGEEVAVLMQTNLSNGDAQSVGQACLLTFALANAGVFSEGMPPEVAVEYRTALATVIEHIAPDLFAATGHTKARSKRSAPATAPADVSRETSPADANGDAPSVADVAYGGLIERLAATGHSGMDDE